MLPHLGERSRSADRGMMDRGPPGDRDRDRDRGPPDHGFRDDKRRRSPSLGKQDRAKRLKMEEGWWK